MSTFRFRGNNMEEIYEGPQRLSPLDAYKHGDVDQHLPPMERRRSRSPPSRLQQPFPFAERYTFLDHRQAAHTFPRQEYYDANRWQAAQQQAFQADEPAYSHALYKQEHTRHLEAASRASTQDAPHATSRERQTYTYDPTAGQRLRRFAYTAPRSDIPEQGHAATPIDRDTTATSSPRIEAAVPSVSTSAMSVSTAERVHTIADNHRQSIPKQAEDHRIQPGNAGIQLVPVSRIPERFKKVFPFPLFNAVQSKCFEAVARSDENVVISAPTVLFELAILRMLIHSDTDKAVYMAPTKSLCSEKATEWQAKFKALGYSVVELTGDSDVDGIKEAKTARVIVTTPEKWDSLTRYWNIHDKLLQSMALVLIDEVHTLREKSRGPRFEIVVSRMRAFGNNVRFIAVSATVPNVIDIAEWIGSRGGVGLARTGATSALGAAVMFEFGNEFRPCQLEKHVYGYANSRDQWSFQTLLHSKLSSIIAERANDKPTLIFFPTRKGTVQAAQTLHQDYARVLEEGRRPPPWTVQPTHGTMEYSDEVLRELAKHGIAFHHAGLELKDRRLVEHNFLQGSIRVLCCTSTLAVGVNLPAHSVIICGTQRYEGRWVELPDLDVLQMLGRAGRPQFDQTGVAVIMTEQSRVEHYQQMASGQTAIESSLHEELIEHVNSEIGLREDCTEEDLQIWLDSTFLAVRLRKNSSYYKAADGSGDLASDERLSNIFADALAKLCSNGLVSRGGVGGHVLLSTEEGKTLTTHMVSFATMMELLKLENASMRDILTTISSAKQFSDIRMRPGEKAAFEKLRNHSEIRFPPNKIHGVPEKVNLLIQTVLAGIPPRGLLETKGATADPLGEVAIIWRHCGRLIKAIADIAINRSDATTAKNAFELLRSINARCWDNSPLTMKQLDGIGEKSVKILADAGISSYQQVAKSDPLRLEFLLGKNPPFGRNLKRQANCLPHLDVDIVSVQEDQITGTARVAIRIDAGRRSPVESMPKSMSKGEKPKPLRVTLLTMRSDGAILLDFRRVSLSWLQGQKDVKYQVDCKLTKAGQKVVVLAGVEEIAGSCIRREHQPRVKISSFPLTERVTNGDLDDEWQELQDCPNLFAGDDDLEDLATTAGKVIDRMRPQSCAADQDENRFPAASSQALPIVQSSDARSTSEEGRLPNGNLACKHRCRDRSACRHLCCKEGMPKRSNSNTKSFPAAKRQRKTLEDEEGFESDNLSQADNLTSEDELPTATLEDVQCFKRNVSDQPKRGKKAFKAQGDALLDRMEALINQSNQDKVKGSGAMRLTLPAKSSYPSQAYGSGLKGSKRAGNESDLGSSSSSLAEIVFKHCGSNAGNGKEQVQSGKRKMISSSASSNNSGSDEEPTKGVTHRRLDEQSDHEDESSPRASADEKKDDEESEKPDEDSDGFKPDLSGFADDDNEWAGMIDWLAEDAQKDLEQHCIEEGDYDYEKKDRAERCFSSTGPSEEDELATQLGLTYSL
ncbi:unnamed protein product [Sympodiomycopsis kandeliae]